VPSLTPRRRSSGENLIIELFEAINDLTLLHDPLEGADFVLRIALENMPSAVAMVSFFSFDSREFVAVRAAGEAVGPAVAQAIILKRIDERSAIPTRAMRTHQTVVLDEGEAMDALAEDPRWVAAGIVPAHYMCAPVALGGRYLGLLEIANPLDGVAFSAEDGYALTYMGQQLGEFLAQRDLVLDPERITAPRLNARIRRG
jgi:GAF domain-containing protein